MSDRRVLVTGSREWGDRKAVFDALDLELADHAWACKQAGEDWTITVVHGACPTGADHYARMWYESRQVLWHEHVSEDAWPARWRLLGSGAGPARNTVMVNAGADECLAFYWQGAANAGTSDCAEKARAAGIHVREIKGP